MFSAMSAACSDRLDVRRRGSARRGGYAAALAVCTVNLLANFAIGIVVPVLPLYMRGVLGASDVSVGVVMASYAVTTLASRPLGGLGATGSAIVVRPHRGQC